MTKQESIYFPMFHVMTKPAGPNCNLACKYCFYSSKKNLFPKSNFRMSDEILEIFTKQYIEANYGPIVTFAWQGGEPTLFGIDFFKKAIQYQKKYKKPNQKIENTFQTNGTLINDDWAIFLAENNFLVGLSLDGPPIYHDEYRKDNKGGNTAQKVIDAYFTLIKHNVKVNILSCVHSANVGHPLEVYNFFKNELKAQFIQFIPIVESHLLHESNGKKDITDITIQKESYGVFLLKIFREWVKKDVGKIFIQIFDVALAAWVGLPPGLCVFSETCGNAVALEHTGDLYSCDHFVFPDYYLGNIREKTIGELVNSEKQFKFGQLKKEKLPTYCLKCQYKFVCNGGCPKNRISKTLDGEDGLNYLCKSYKIFFKEITPYMNFMAEQIKKNRSPATIMSYIASGGKFKKVNKRLKIKNKTRKKNLQKKRKT